MTIKTLRDSGYKVRVLHFRRKKSDIILPKGGYTQILIDGPNGSHFEGIARCSDQDNYNKKLGVRIALGRAMFGESN